MLNRSKTINENYAARIARIDEIHQIPDAHSIVKAVLGTDTVVVGKDMKVGDIVAYFPEGTCISGKYLGYHNLYDASSAEKNRNYPEYEKLKEDILALTHKVDKSEEDISKLQELEARRKRMVGFFNSQGRVRCLKLRGQMSMGYVAPVSTLEEVWPELKLILWSRELDKDYDMVGEEKLCWKYIPPVKPEQTEDFGGNAGYPMTKFFKSLRELKKFDRLIPGFFKPHYDTAHLERNVHLIEPEDVITETVKVHGTSVILANLPVRKQLKWYQKVLNKIGAHFSDREFGTIYSTRRVIQNKYINPKASRANNEPGNEYEAVNADFINFLSPGTTVYGEIVGYKPSGKPIQAPKGITHDYGCNPYEYKFMPYRITETDENGVVEEWSITEVMAWTDSVRDMLPDEEKYKIMSMVLLYHGRAGDQYDLYDKIKAQTKLQDYEDEYNAFVKSEDFKGFIPKRLESFDEFVKNKWRVAWIEAMRADKTGLGFELHEPLCKHPKAPREGIVVRIDGDPEARAWKLKTAAHAELSQKAKDAGEADPEDLA